MSSRARGSGRSALRAGITAAALAAPLAACQPGPFTDFEPIPPSPRVGPTVAAHDELHPPERLAFEPEDRPAPDPEPDGPLRLSVEQSVMLALRNNRSLRVQQYQPMIAGTFERLERAVFDPLLFADIATSRERRQQTSAATGETFGIDSERNSGEVSILQPLPTGTEIGLDFSHVQTDSDRFVEQHVPRAGLSLNQALLAGRGREANLARIRQAQLDVAASEYELRGFAEALAADVETTFWDYALAQREIEIFESSLELAGRQLRETEQRIEVGVLAETELAAPRAEVALRREELINARSLLEQLRLRLLRLINPASAEGWARRLELLTDITMPDVDLAPVEQHMEVARNMRPDLNEARLLLQRGRLEVVRTRDGLLPRLDLFLTLGKTGFSDSFGDAYRQLVSETTHDLAAGVSFEYPLGNRAAEADHDRARLTRRQARESVHNLAQLVDLDVQLAYLEVERTREQIQATAATRELREETLRAETEKFRAGTTTAFLVAQAQRDLLESQIAEARALVAYRQALIELYRLEGTLLLRRAIQAPGEAPLMTERPAAQRRG